MEKLRAGAPQRTAQPVDVAEAKQHPAKAVSPAGVDGRTQIHVAVPVQTPRYARTIREARVTHRKRLPMPPVAPVGDQESTRTVSEPVLGRQTQVFAHIARAASKAVPR